MGKPHDREAVWRDRCADFDFDSELNLHASPDDRRGLHPKRRGRRSRDRDAWRDRRLCGQVRQAIQMGLADCGDPRLQSLVVLGVEPDGKASRLRVHVMPGVLERNDPTSPEDPAWRADLSARLALVGPRLRGEVARSIHRKKTPQLVFELHPPEATDE
ncbi:MAG: hypothetical protein AAGF84_14375 [Planctomycetota bacterium]